MMFPSTTYAQEILDNKINEGREAEHKEKLKRLRSVVSSEGSSFITLPIDHSTGHEYDTQNRFNTKDFKQKKSQRPDINAKPLLKKRLVPVKPKSKCVSSYALTKTNCQEQTLNNSPIEPGFTPRSLTQKSGDKAALANISKIKTFNTSVQKSSEADYLEPISFSSGSSHTATKNLTQVQNSDNSTTQHSLKSPSEECHVTSFIESRLKLLKAFKRSDSAQSISGKELDSAKSLFVSKSSSNENVTSSPDVSRSQYPTSSSCENHSISTFQANRLKLLEAFKREDSDQFISSKELHSQVNPSTTTENSNTNLPQNTSTVVPCFTEQNQTERNGFENNSSFQSLEFSSSKDLSKVNEQKHPTSNCEPRNPITQLVKTSEKGFDKTVLLVRPKPENCASEVLGNQSLKNTVPTPGKLKPEAFSFMNVNKRLSPDFQMESSNLTKSSNDVISFHAVISNSQLQRNDLSSDQTKNLSRDRPKIPPKPPLLSQKSPNERVSSKSSYPSKNTQFTVMSATEDRVNSVNHSGKPFPPSKKPHSGSVELDEGGTSFHTESIHDDSEPDLSECQQKSESGSLERVHRSSIVPRTPNLHYHRSDSYLSSKNDSKGSTDDLERNVSDVQNSSTESENDDFMMRRNYLDRPSLPLRTLPRRSMSCSSLVQTFKELSPNRIFSLTRNVKAIVKKKTKSHSVIESPKLEFLPKPEATEIPEEPSPMSSSIPAFLYRKAWFHEISSAEAKRRLLEMNQDGAFLVRPSSSGDVSSYTLCFTLAGRVSHCHIRQRRDGNYALGYERENEKTYSTLSEMIQYHQDIPLEIKRPEGVPSCQVYLLITPPNYANDST